MRFVCDSCRAQYMISDDKVGAKGVKVRCKKCGHVILVRAGSSSSKDDGAPEAPVAESPAAAASHGEPSASAAGALASLGTPPEGGLFTGVEEDEIGAVFDQVLNSGSHKLPAGEALGGDARDSKSSTPAAVRKLAEAESEPDEPKAAAPANDWYVAIDEKQVGPLSIEKVKEHWDRGEVGPDSLCWRAGLGDWVPLSEATELASVLAPRPAKPVIVAPAAVAAQAPSASAPVESAFSAGAAAKNTRTEVPAAPALGQEPPSSGWKPSAASVLASLVKEENDALSKPPPKPVVEEKAVPGLLDLPPPEPALSPAARAASVMAASAEPAMRAPQPAAMPYAPAPTPAYAQPSPAYAQPTPAYAGYPQPAYPGYPPSAVPGGQGGNNKMFMVAGLAAVGALLLAAVLFFALREPPASNPPAVAAATPPVAEKPPEVPVTPPPGTAPAQPVANSAAANPTTPAPAPTPAPAVAPAAGTPPAAVATPPPAAVTPPPPAVAEAPTTKPTALRADPPAIARQEPRTTTPRRTESGATASASAPAPAKAKPSDDGLDDDFDDLFGKKPEKKGSGGTGATPSTYIPPEPASASSSSLEKLGQSDIMAVVVANKPAIKKCVDEQKKRDPGSSGRLVMRWTIQPSGRTTAVSIKSEEFKKTYLASCMSGLIKGWNFPKHRKQGEPIDFPFIF